MFMFQDMLSMSLGMQRKSDYMKIKRILICLSMIILCGFTFKSNVNALEFTQNGFQFYELLSDSDLRIINDYFDNYYSNSENLKIAFGLHKVNDFNFYSNDLYFGVLDFSSYDLQNNFLLFGYGEKEPDIFVFHLDNSSIEKYNGTYSSLAFNNSLNVYYSYLWLNGTQGSQWSYLSLPLWFSENGVLTKERLSNSTDFYWSSDFDFTFDYGMVDFYYYQGDLSQYYDPHDYFKGNDAVMRSYIEYRLGDSDAPPDTSVNWYVDIYVYDDLVDTFTFTGNIGNDVTYTPESYYDIYSLLNPDVSFVLPLSSDESENHIRVDYIYSGVLNYYIDYYYNDEYNHSEVMTGEYRQEVWHCPNYESDYLYLVDSQKNCSSIILDIDDTNNHFAYYYYSDFIKTKDSKLYFFIHWEDIEKWFPSINFNRFSYSTQLSVLISINLLFLAFMAFVIWIVLKMLYKFFQWI